MLNGNDEFDWQELLLYIEGGRVVPIVGRDLLLEPRPDGTVVALTRRLVQRLAPELGMPEAAHMDLPEFAFEYLQRHPANKQRIYSRIKFILEDDPPGTPVPLRQLAEITDLDLFVSTTFDGLMARALDETRYGGQETAVRRAYQLYKRPPALAGAGPWDPALVYQLFGEATGFPDFAVTEEDTLEFVHRLQGDGQRPQGLFDALKDRELLFIGCGFTDWLARFFIRTVRNERFSVEGARTAKVADTLVKRDEPLVVFLRHYGTEVFHAGGAVEFVAELHRRWTSRTRRHTPGSPDLKMTEGAVFLSFSSHDRASVRKIRDAMEAAGIETWLDERDIEPGTNWDASIQENIWRCSLFVSFLSRQAEAEPEGFFRFERKLALQRSSRFAENVPFVLPVALDDIPITEPTLPPELTRSQWIRLTDGQATQDFLGIVRQAVRRVRAPHYPVGSK